jgi:hypothetical protein
MRGAMANIQFVVSAIAQKAKTWYLQGAKHNLKKRYYGHKNKNFHPDPIILRRLDASRFHTFMRVCLVRPGIIFFHPATIRGNGPGGSFREHESFQSQY